MKKLIIFMALAIFATSMSAQSAIELAKQQKELNDINMKMLNAKPSKDARKQAKKLMKEGWTVPAGSKAMEKQITEAQLVGEELMADETGNPTKRFIMQQGLAVSGTYNAGLAAARANAQVEIASALKTQIAAAMETKIDNQQASAISAVTVEKFHERAKSIVDACLTNTRMLVAVYRVNKQNNYEVQVTVAFDKKELASRMKRKMQEELEKEGDDDLGGIVDEVLNNYLQ